MGAEAGKEFFDNAYRLGNKRIDAGYGWPIKGVSAETKEFLKTIQKSTKTGRVMDIGCGEGRMCIFFEKNGYHAYGIDYSETAIKRAKKSAKEEGVQPDFRTGNVLELPYPGNFFDVAVDWSVFDHIEPENHELYLDNLLRVLRKGGFYMLAVFSASTPWMRSRKKSYYSGDAYFQFFDEDDIRRIFGKHFDIIAIKESMHANPPPEFVFYHALMRRK